MRQPPNKSNWHEFRKICHNCVFWQPDSDDTPTGVCLLTDNTAYEGLEACNDLIFIVYEERK